MLVADVSGRLGFSEATLCMWRAGPHSVAPRGLLGPLEQTIFAEQVFQPFDGAVDLDVPRRCTPAA